MAHARKLIRDKAAELLTGLDMTGTNVEASRVYAVPEKQLPHLSIYTNSEAVEEDEGVFGDEQSRLLELVIEGRQKKSGTLEDDLDQIALEVEQILNADKTLAGLAEECTYRETEIEMDKEAEKPVGIVRLIYMVLYRVDATAPDTIIS